ncbi:MAG: hypothetical protein ACOX5R_11150 [bacterium]|jgi:hypothetical protein
MNKTAFAILATCLVIGLAAFVSTAVNQSGDSAPAISVATAGDSCCASESAMTAVAAKPSGAGVTAAVLEEGKTCPFSAAATQGSCSTSQIQTAALEGQVNCSSIRTADFEGNILGKVQTAALEQGSCTITQTAVAANDECCLTGTVQTALAAKDDCCAAVSVQTAVADTISDDCCEGEAVQTAAASSSPFHAETTLATTEE